MWTSRFASTSCWWYGSWKDVDDTLCCVRGVRAVFEREAREFKWPPVHHENANLYHSFISIIRKSLEKRTLKYYVNRYSSTSSKSNISLIVCPSTLTRHWILEIAKFFPSRRNVSVEYAGPRRALPLLPYDKDTIVVTSYVCCVLDQKITKPTKITTTTDTQFFARTCENWKA